MTEDSSTIIAEPRTSPLRFFLLVFALSLPFWLAGALTTLQLLPGIPVSGFAFLCPAMAAAMVVSRENTPAGVKQ